MREENFGGGGLDVSGEDLMLELLPLEVRVLLPFI